jgi:high affinity Mn2+ porin
MKKNKLYLIVYGVVLAILGHRLALATETADHAAAVGNPAPAGVAPTPGVPGPTSYWPRLVGVQYTWIRQHQYALHSPYRGNNSLDPTGDTQATHTIGLYFGWALTDRLQAYLDTEKFNGAGVSGATGLGGVTNGDVVRQGSANLHKDFYVARKYLRYMVPLSREVTEVERSQDHLPGKEAVMRLEFKAGTMATTDDFDLNRYANSTRTQFLNWSLWNNTAWDYAADTRGYTNGVMVAYISPSWSLRLGIYQMPSEANGYNLDGPLSKAREENIELTLAPNEAGTVVRLLAYCNLARMGVYREAMTRAASTNTTPDIVADDQSGRKKIGYGINLEQPLADAGETGVFLRAGWNDGKTESFAFTEVDRTLTVGVQIAGNHWGQGVDRLGLAIVVNGLSKDHRDYLAAGGSGFMLGDGQLNYGTEQIVEVYYRIQLQKYVQLSPDFQYIRNPGYNRDRGPARFVGLRLHVEY